MVRRKMVGMVAFAFLMVFLFPSHGADFSVNPSRIDPYKQCKFRVKWDGKIVPGVISVDGLRKEFEIVGSGTGKKSAPGKPVNIPIRIDRGRTHDTSFEKWVDLVGNGTGKRGGDAKEYRKDIVIELLNEAGQVVMAFKVIGCWPSSYSAIESLDSNNAEIAIESIVLEHDGWERDMEIGEPVQP